MSKIRFVVAAALGLAGAAPTQAQVALNRTLPDQRPDPLPPVRNIPLLKAADSTKDNPLRPLEGAPTKVDRPIVLDVEHRARQEVAYPAARSVDYSGPRFGVTWLPRAAVDSLKAHNIKVGQTITQYGWQMEHEIHVTEDGPRVLNEWVLLAGGLESGVFLPSFTWLIGARDKGGNEIGVGPNGSIAGVGLAAAAGVTLHSGGINFPINVAVAKSKTGARYSVLTGFTIH